MNQTTTQDEPVSISVEDGMVSMYHLLRNPAAHPASPPSRTFCGLWLDTKSTRAMCQKNDVPLCRNCKARTEQRT